MFSVGAFASLGRSPAQMLRRATSRARVPCVCSLTAGSLVRVPWYLGGKVADGRHDVVVLCLPRASVRCSLVAPGFVEGITPQAFRVWMLFSHCISIPGSIAKSQVSAFQNESRYRPVASPASVHIYVRKARGRGECKVLAISSETVLSPAA
jgi:hypothetical protein